MFQEDPTINLLERRVAMLFEKEAALFCPTGTMANLIACMTWCDGRGSEMILGASSHIFLYEQAGSAFLGGIGSRSIANKADGTLDIDEIVSAVRASNVHYPVTRLVALEQTQNFCGGRVLPIGYIQKVVEAVSPYKVAVHIDGARIWNASAATGQSVADLTRGADSISICMSKGLGSPAGSLLVGPSVDWISKARRLRKALGGGMRQAGVLAAACLQGLDDFEAGILRADHIGAKRFATAVSAVEGFSIDVSAVESNIVVVYLDREKTSMSADDVVKLLKDRNVLVGARDASSIRVVTHRDLSELCVDKLISSFIEISELVCVCGRL